MKMNYLITIYHLHTLFFTQADINTESYKSMRDGTRLDIASVNVNVSGLKFSNVNSTTPIGVGQTLGIAATGNVITMPNAAPTTLPNRP